MELVKIFLSCCFSIGSIVALIACKLNDSLPLGIVLFVAMIYVSYKLLRSLSQETLNAAADYEHEKKHKK